MVILPLIFNYATTLGKTSTVEVFSIPDMQFFASSAMSISPDTLVLIICMMAFLIGPCLFICLYSTAYVIDMIIQYFFPEDQPPIELGPDTCVGCPDGLCYLHMFMSRYHDLITRRLGHFPSIFALSTVSKSYRRNHARGKLELIGDGLANYEPDVSGDLVWEIVEKLIILDLIGGWNLVKISSKPPKGYGYIELFNPPNYNDILVLTLIFKSSFQSIQIIILTSKVSYGM